MATKSTEPAVESTSGTATAKPANPNKLVYVYDTNSKQKLPYPVPTSWLDGRFPHLKEQPSKKAGN